jgi:hypothetical protein
MVLDIENVDPDEILILTGISGLSSPKANLFLGDFAREGGYYQGRRAQKLNPVFNFKINEDYVNDIDASEIREMLYRMFYEPTSSSDAVQVTLKDNKTPDRYFLGYTEAIEAELFTDKPSAQVSMLTTDPYLRSVSESGAVSPGGWLTRPVKYDGTAETGVELELKVTHTTSSITIIQNLTVGKRYIILDRTFYPGDIIKYGSNPGNHYIKVNDVDRMVALRAPSSDPQSELAWFPLAQDTVNFQAHRTAGAPGDGSVLITSYKYRSAWWGI